MAISSREVIKRLKKEGWMLVHVVGSHHHYKHPKKMGRVTVPHPKKDLRKQTLLSICGQAGWDGWNPDWKKKESGTEGREVFYAKILPYCYSQRFG